MKQKVRHGGVLVDCAMLITMSIGPDGKRTLLGVSVALSEAEVHWRTFPPVTRSHHRVQIIISSAHPGLSAARQADFASVPRQRCQFHLQQIAQAYAPRLDMRFTVVLRSRWYRAISFGEAGGARTGAGNRPIH